jgi:MFS family permease
MTRPTSPAPAAKILILLAVCLAAAAMPLTFTGPAVALPAIARDLGGSPVALGWVTNAFMLTFGSCLMAAGALADSYGRKRVFVSGVAGFILAALAAALAPSILWFDLARAAQGLASAAAFSGGMAALAQEFTGPGRLRAFSLVGASFGVGLSLGPIASGLLIAALGWRSIFALVIALAAIACILGARNLRETTDPAARGLDWPGAISFTAALTALTAGMLRAPEDGWSDALVLGFLMAALVLAIAFVAIERRVTRPMLDLSLFRYPRFVGVQLLAAAPAYAFVVLLILLPLRFVGIEGLSEIAAGRLMIALSAPLLILPIIAGQLTRWMSPASLCGSGLLIAAAGLTWLSRIAIDAPQDAVMAPMLLIGIGISLPWGLMDGLAVSVVPSQRAGMAAGIFSTTRVAGEGIALALVSAVLSALTAGNLSGAASDPRAITAAAQHLVTGDLGGAQASLPQLDVAMLQHAYGDGFTTLLLILAGITTLTALVVFVGLRQPARDEACEVPQAG